MLWFHRQFDYYNSVLWFYRQFDYYNSVLWFYVLWFYRQFDYYNSMLINSGDEDGNFAPLGGDFPLEENEHFNQLLVNVQQSDIQVPTNVYNRGLTPRPPRPSRTSIDPQDLLSDPCSSSADPNILNAIYNSEALNDVFINNFQKDPTLTWQYFGSSTGFFRIYPGENS